MAGGKAPKTSTQYVETSTSNLPKYAEPYYTSMMGQAQALTAQPYTPYGGERIAGFTPQQQQAQQSILNQQTPGQFGTATGLGTAAGLGSLAASRYDPTQFNAQMIGQPNLQQFRMDAPREVQGQQYNAPGMQAAQSGYAPNLDYFQMAAPERFGGVQAAQYMSPFVQQALEPQMREAITSAKRGQLAEDLGAARQGTYGGSRQLLASMERERNLGQQLGDIYGRGMQSAYENAQAQFERDRAAGMTAGQENLRAQLGVQQLGTQTGLQTALANLDAASQANVQNLAAQLQTQGLNAEQALRAALANQQADLTVGQQNLQSALQTQQLGTETGLRALLANQQMGLEAQRLGEQSRQFGATQGLAGLAQAGQMAQTLGNLGQMQGQLDMSRLNQQQATAAQEQELQQRYLDMQYQDFLRQQDYPFTQLQRYSSLLQGVPVQADTTQTTRTPSQSLGSQIMQAGLGGLSMARMAGAI